MIRQIVTLKSGTSIEFVVDDQLIIYAHFPGDKIASPVGQINQTHSGRYGWWLAQTNYWTSYSTIKQLPICTSISSAFKLMLAFVTNGQYHGDCDV